MFKKKELLIILILAVLVVGLIIGTILVGGWRKTKVPSPMQIKQVTIATDKTEYKQGETVKITVRNGLDKPIWYTDFGCYPWWKLEEQEGENWQSIEVLLPTLTEYGEKCIACPPPQSIEEVLKELKPNSEVNMVWNLKNCKELTPTLIEFGNYRLSFTYGLRKDFWDENIIYSNEFVIKESSLKNPQTECGGSCRCMKECNKEGPVYFIHTEGGSSECSVNSVNKTCCCSGV